MDDLKIVIKMIGNNKKGTTAQFFLFCSIECFLAVIGRLGCVTSDFRKEKKETDLVTAVFSCQQATQKAGQQSQEAAGTQDDTKKMSHLSIPTPACGT